MKNTTLLFLVKRNINKEITDICLAMKKRGFGVGRYNGVGGKVEEGESIDDAVRREAHEEIGVVVRVMEKCGELTFTFPHKSDWNQLVHVYLSEDWDGKPVETEEMNPVWMSVKDIPYATMWPDDIFWLPKVLEGNAVRGRFTFAEGDVVVDQEVNIITF